MSWCWIAASCLLSMPCGQVFIEPIEFDITSEHGLMHRDTANLAEPGERWDEPEWRFGRSNIVPFTHDGGKQARLAGRLKLKVEGVKPGSLIRIRGLSHEPGFNVAGEVVVSPGDDNAGDDGDDDEAAAKKHAGPVTVVAEVKAGEGLGTAVRKISQPIVWFAEVKPPGEGKASKHDLGPTSPLVGYVLRGRPKMTDQKRGVVTPRRLSIAVERYNNALANAGENPSSLAIVAELVGRMGKHYLPTRHYEEEDAWNVPETWVMKDPGASCFSIISYSINLLNMVGQEGEYDMVTYTATLENPTKAVLGSLGSPPVRKPAIGDYWQLFLVDDRNTKLGQAGGLGGVNFYEAVMRYKFGGRTYFMPGGTSRVYTNPDDILRVFRTMAWARYDNWKKEWRVVRVVHTYVRPGEGSPYGVDVSEVSSPRQE
ncbi:MAG: hypothetical protein ACKO26_13115 [Planctomycetota bacterium]